MPYLKGKLLTCYSFMDAGKRHKIPGSETNHFITHSNSHSQRISSYAGYLSSTFHKTKLQGPDDASTCSGFVTDRNYDLGELQFFYSWQLVNLLLCSGGRPSLSSKAVSYIIQASLKRQSRTQAVRSLQDVKRPICTRPIENCLPTHSTWFR